MTERKLPATADWQNRPIEKWNTTTFRYYVGHIHETKWGIPYLPFGTWQIEMKHTKDAIDLYGAEVLKQLIDEIAATWTPTANYPGFNIGFILKFRGNVLQNILMERHAAAKRAEMVTNTDPEEFEW